MGSEVLTSKQEMDMQITNAAALTKAVAMLDGARATITARQILAAAANIEQHMAKGSYSLLKQTELGYKRDESGKQYMDVTVTADDIGAYIDALKAAI